jgi:uncharacterized DUF497 family protein
VSYRTRFDWDAAKARQNRAAHDISFDEAAIVLGQDDAEIYLLEFYDDEHSTGEDRFSTFGSLPQDRAIVLRITWTEREDDAGPITRIISARPATPKQRSEYAEEVQKRLRR